VIFLIAIPAKAGIQECENLKMDALTLIGTAFALAMDAFAVAIAVAVSLRDHNMRHVFRLSWHFGLFQAIMPIGGWFIGEAVVTYTGSLGNWIACAILTILGGKMIWESFHEEEIVRDFDPTRGMSLVVLSVATSLDALAVGVSLALLNVSVWFPAAVIGIVALAMTALGMALGKRAGLYLGEWAERFGGAVLILIGLKILFLK
jgi:putative Mn2+ efflux pump MntP